MEVILLEKIHKLGKLGDKVDVRAGYGRNFLIPHGKALPANKHNLAEFEAKRDELEKRAQEILNAAQKRASAISALTIKIPAMVGDEGKLFGSVGTRDIADAITQAGVEVQKSEVLMPNGAIRFLGEYEIELQLTGDVAAKVKVEVVPEAAK